ncbi:MAG TPA: energy-coupling factor transporter transmembrane component T [Alkalispirochaeta sp.]|nr:energy-coupling factor transporter transmembrane component T [Alkalispirochaeta sp.]
MRYTVFENYEKSSPLAAVNPSVKLIASVVVMLFVSVVFDHHTLAAVIALGAVLVLGVGRVHPVVLGRAMVPFLIFGFGFLWMNALLPRTAGTPLFTVGPVVVSWEGVRNGVSFALRAIAFGVWSLLFVATTEPTSFVLSLVQQLRVPPKLAYSALAAYRYLPSLQIELEQIRGAHRLRGVGESGGLQGRIQRVYRYTVPLLAGALRRASRVAAAMEARGFSGTGRSWYRWHRLTWWDALYLITVLGGTAAIVWMSWRSGSLRVWTGRLWE